MATLGEPDLDRIARVAADTLRRDGAQGRSWVIAVLVRQGVPAERAEAAVEQGLSTGVLVLLGDADGPLDAGFTGVQP
jgi:hypothetical protein